MRLTLRTLLAWRDGLLGGPEAEEISAKVTEGSVARGLLDRMKSLETRTDVEVPKLEGRGLAADANSVAAYLENTLDSEKLEAFERICLESDRHLAEVSECHELLAEASAFRYGPEALPPLVAAVAVRLEGGQAAATVSGEQQTAASLVNGPRQPLAPRGRGRSGRLETAVEQPVIRLAAEPAGESSPRISRRGARRSSPWLQVAAAVGLLCLAGGGLGIVLWWNPGVPDAAEESRLAAVAEPEVMPVAEQVGDAVADADRPEASPDGRAQPQAADPPAAAVAAETAANGPAEFGEDGTEPTSTEPLARAAATPPPDPQPPLGVGPRVPMGDALAIAAPPAPSPDALLPPAQAPEPPESAAAGEGSAGPIVPVVSAIGVLSRGPMVLVSEAAPPGKWLARLPGEPLTTGVQVLAAPASQPELDLGGVVVRLAPQSQVVLREPTNGRSDVDLEVVFGKAVVRRTTGDATVSLRAAGLQWQLSGPPAAALVEVTLGRDAGGDPGADAFVLASVAAADGGLEWTPLDGSAVLAGGEAGGTLPQATEALWSSENPTVFEMRPARAERWQAFSAAPERLAATAVEALAAAVRGREGDVLAAARQQGSSRRVENREAAAATLALVGDYSAAVAILCDDAVGTRLGERRWRSFQQQVVPLALARGVHSAERFRQSLVQHLGEGAGERVFQLAVGISDAQLAADGDAALVAALDDPQLVVRRYAALRLDEIVDPGPRDRLRYRADAAADLRAEGVRWWAVQLEKGLIQRPKPGQLSGPDAG